MSHYLPIFRHNATLELMEMLPAVLSGPCDWKLALRFCKQYRIRAISSLLLDARALPFLVDLRRSGRAFSHFLRSAIEQEKSTAKSLPFFDAIASGDLACAREIARNSRLIWNEDEEYEDDFHYVLFLMKYFFLGAQPAECENLLKRYEEILEGQPDPRLEICSSFQKNDGQRFDAALEELIENHESHYHKLIQAEAITPEEAATEAKIFIEGLALLRLADAKGFALEEDYMFLPQVAREQISLPGAAEDWRDPSG